MCNYFKFFSFTFFLSLIFLNGLAQQSYIYNDNHLIFKKALEYFEEEKYSVSQFFFEKYLHQNKKSDLLESDAAYYIAISGIELFHTDVNVNMNEFLSKYQENPRIPYANYKMGLFNYQNKKFKKALPWFEKVNIDYLSKDELAEYHFKIGYCYFVENEFDKAEKHFYEIKDIPNKYHGPALYFYSHIAYTKKNYEVALNGFKRLQNDETFSTIVPYYITQILFFQGKYEDVIQYAPVFLDSANTHRGPEIARIIGESFYRLERYKEAIPYLEKYASSIPLNRSEMYQLGYAYYKIGMKDKTVNILEKIQIQEDSLSQQTLYLLADCYLYIGLKNNARLALEKTYKMSFYPEIQEESMFNYAKLSFELSYTPFNEAIRTFQEYINKYPNSPRIDDAHFYLSKAFLFSKNYKDALEALENIKIITPEIEEAYQKTCFFRGLELFNNGDYEQAIIHFDKSLNNAKYNKYYAAESQYWKAEAYYRLNNFDDALKNFKKFIVTPGAYETRFFVLAHYDIGYCYIKQNNYNEAQLWFRKYIENETDKNKAQIYDAYSRIADSYFVLRRYEDAIEYYSKAIVAKKASPDYALYQKAICLGLLNKYREKIITLTELLDNYPSSTYIDDAIYELGLSYANIDENEMAINTLKKLISEYPKSNLLKRAYVQLGLIYYNIDKNDDAIKMFKYVIENYPNTQEYKDAFVGLKNVYIDMNDINSYYAYVNEKGKDIVISQTEKDSITYTVAEKVYMSGDCSKAKTLFSDYITNFNNGIFRTNAHYYLAECFLKEKNYDEAYNHYLEVIKQPNTPFTEPSLVKVANFLYNKNRYSEAKDYFEQLLAIAQYDQNKFSAKSGLMRCYFELKKYEDATRFAIDILKENKVSDELYKEAHFIIGKSAYMQNNFEQALDEFKLISKNCKSKEEAESKYLIVEIYYKQNHLDDAEKEVFDFVKKNTPHQYWLGKAFLVLADIYIARNDNFQAKATLQSIIDNYKIKDDGIVDEAKQKLNNIIESEKVLNAPLEIETPQENIIINE